MASMEWAKVTVICFFICVVKCAAMSISELEEFSNFLEKTARLDETLKKGTSSDGDFDEEETLSDHAWEESGKFEGDLILNDRQRRLLVEDVAEGLSRNGLQDSTKRWPNNEVIYYIQREHFSGDQVQAIEDGINDLAQASCIKFRPYKKGDRDAVVIQGSRRGCFSQVGYQGGYQVLNLSGRHPVGRGCFRHGTVVHEFLHSLGFYHMQSSPDRDDYIDVVWENIIEPAKHNFRKYNSFAVSDFGVGYDYDSVLHYSRRAFSANGKDTLVPKQSGASIGQRRGLSDKDTQKLNKMYCDADTNNDGLSEDTIQKTANEKKSTKNKPFEGHGIGYHQGKTVVIKLPTAETYKLPELPKFHVFDYFSKAPQAVSSTLAEGKGKEIKYSYSSPATSTDENYGKNTKLQDKTNSADTLENTKKYELNADNYPNEDNYYNKDTNFTNETVNENTNTEDSVNSPKSKDPSPEFHESNDHYLDDAFERLGKIIKTHVYPSQLPNLDIYKPKLDYSDFYNPERKTMTKPEIEKVDKEFHSSFLNKEKEAKHNYVKVLKSEDKVDEKNTNNFDKDQYALDESPPYATQLHLKHKQNYSSLYHPDNEFKGPSDFDGKHKIFSDIATIYDDKPDANKYDNDKYKQDSYTYSSSEEDNSNYEDTKPSRLKLSKEDKLVYGYSPRNQQSYKLFGILVPLEHDWYKIDYNPHKESYSIEKSNSKENHR